MRLSAVGSVLVAAFGISLIGAIVKLVGNQIPVLSLSFLRVFIAALVLGLIVYLYDRDYFFLKKESLISSAILGFFLALSFATYHIAFLNAPITNIVLVSAVGVVFVAILGFYLLGEKPSGQETLALIVAILGLLILNPIGGGFAKGSMLAIFSSLSYAVAVIYMRYKNSHKELEEVFWSMVFASLFLLPFPVFQGFGNLFSSFSLIFFVLVLGIFSTALAYYFIAASLEKLPAEHVSTLTMVAATIFGVILAVVFFKEQLMPNLVLGGIILVSAGALLEFKSFSASYVENKVLGFVRSKNQ